jgi:hypothetical protein
MSQPQMTQIEQLLFDNFELLFLNEPLEKISIDDTASFENKFRIIEHVDCTQNDTPKTIDKYIFLKREFTKLREIINEESSNMLGGGIKSLNYIKQIIINKIKSIIPRD